MSVIRQKRQVTEKVRSFRDRGEMLQRQLVENTVTHRTCRVLVVLILCGFCVQYECNYKL